MVETIPILPIALNALYEAVFILDKEQAQNHRRLRLAGGVYSNLN
jgi:hypothetical protein